MAHETKELHERLQPYLLDPTRPSHKDLNDDELLEQHRLYVKGIDDILNRVERFNRQPTQTELTLLGELKHRAELAKLEIERRHWHRRVGDPFATIKEIQAGRAKIGMIMKSQVGGDAIVTKTVTPNWLVKALSESSGPGSVIVPEEYLAQVWDALTAEAVALRAGITVMETNTDTLHIPVVDADMAASWVAEGATITASDPAYRDVVAKPKKLAALVVVSNEVLRDSNPDALQLVSRQLTRALALKLDHGIFEGSGTDPEIRGLKNVAGIQTVSMGADGGQLTNLDPFATAISALEQANARATAIIMHPRTWGDILKLKESTGSNKPVIQDEVAGGVGATPRRSLYGVPVYLSSQLSITETQGTATNASSAYVIDASQVILVRRQDVEVETDPYSKFNSDQTQIRAVARFDLVVPHPQAVVRIAGILPS